MLTKTVLTEEQEQKALVQYLRLLKNQNKIIEFYATTNENNSYKQDRRYAMIAEQKAKAMGKKKGVSDITIVLKDIVLFIELKRQGIKLKNGNISHSNSKISKEQQLFIDTVNKSNVCKGYIAYGFEEAKNIVSLYLE